MSDKDPNDQPDPKDAPQDAPKDPDYKAEAEKWKALARKHEAQAKANADKAKKLDELEDASKSEVEKATAKVTEAEKRAQEAELRALRLEIAAEKGLTPAQAKRLVGTNREELEADADELVETFKPDDNGGKQPPPGKPKENLRGGSDPTEDPEPDLRKVVDKIPRGF